MTRSPRLFVRLLAVFIAVGGAVLVQLVPFDVQPGCADCVNGAEVVSEGGFRFETGGLVLDRTAGGEITRQLRNADGITLSLIARSDALFQQGPARIVTLSSGPDGRNFTIGQQRDAFVLRLRTPGTGPNGSRPATQAPLVFWPGRERLLTASYDGRAFRLFVDGRLVKERVQAAGDLTGWDASFTLAFGNELSGDRPWRGILRDVAIYDRALGAEEIAALTPDTLGSGAVYHLADRCGGPVRRDTDGTLTVGFCEIPARYANAHRFDVLARASRALSDYLFNGVLWVPAGLALAFVGGWHWMWAAPFALAAMGLAELAQAPLFSRTSSAQDLVAGFFGLIVGVCFGWWRRVR